MMNDGKIWAVGYCAEFGGGHHDTAEEAVECYRKWMLDNRLRFRPPVENQQGTYRYCAECKKLTNGYADVNLSIIFLCEEHQTKEIVDKHFQLGGEIWSS